MEGQAEEITRKAIELAKAGDSVAMRLVMERLVSPVRERPVKFELPPIKTAADVVAANSAIAAAVASGDLMPSDAAHVSGIVSNIGKSIEIADIEKRLAALESLQLTGATK